VVGAAGPGGRLLAGRHRLRTGELALNGHVYGSALMVIGGEAGTLAAASEVFRKSRSGETNVLDWAGLVVSLVATLGNLFVVYSALTPLTDAWVALVRSYGPLVLLLCSGLDFYATVMEFGFYNASFDERMETWLLAQHNDKLRWERRQERKESEQKSGSEPQPDESSSREDGGDDGPDEESEPESEPNEESETESEPESNPEPFVCDGCGDGFGTQNALNAHKRFCTGSGSR